MSSATRLPLLAACLLAAGATPATADRGVALDIGRIDVRQDLTPGGSYRLPVLGVRNPGDERTSYRMVVSPVADERRESPREEWFEFSPAELTLDPGETQAVNARITLPSGADPGDYIALVGPQIVAEAAGAQVGAAAAARLTFTVEPASLLEAWWLKVKRFFSDNTPWTWLVPSLLAFAALVALVGRRFSFRVERRRA